jgi:hypothetical protein
VPAAPMSVPIIAKLGCKGRKLTSGILAGQIYGVLRQARERYA